MLPKAALISIPSPLSEIPSLCSAYEFRGSFRPSNTCSPLSVALRGLSGQNGGTKGREKTVLEDGYDWLQGLHDLLGDKLTRLGVPIKCD